MMIYNLTQHKTTIDQQKDSIVDVENHEYICKLLTFDKKPDNNEIKERARLIADYAESINAEKVLIGGAFYLMTYLSKELALRNIKVCYAYSERSSVDQINEDGTVVKSIVFKHTGIIDEHVFDNE